MAELAPRLIALEIDCEYRSHLPVLELNLAALEERINQGREPIPGLLSVPTVTPPLVQHLYELAADFYRAKPWRWLSDLHPIEICYPIKGKPRYAVVMGSGGEVFGLAVYDTLADLQFIYEPLFISQEIGQQNNKVVFYFDEAPAMSFDDLDDAEKYDWPVMNESAYPIFGRSTQQGTLGPPTAADMFWLESALEGILNYVHHHKQIENGIVQPAELTLLVNTLGTKAELKLRLPVFE